MICHLDLNHVWNEFMRKNAFVVKPAYPNVNLQRVNKYLKGTIVSMRKCAQKNTSPPKKGMKEATNIATKIEEIQQPI